MLNSFSSSIDKEILPSVPSSACSEQHHRCTLEDCCPFGKVRSCTVKYLLQLSALITSLNIPVLSVQALSTSENLEATIGLYFGLLPSLNDTEFYERFQLRIQQLRCLKDRLSSLPSIQSNITFCLKQHENPRSGIAVAQVLRNLYGLLKYVHKLESEMESTLSQALDTHPDTTKEILRSVMTLTAKSHEAFREKLPHISFRNFQTFGVGRWLDDEVINYFVRKWCSKFQTTLGLSTFFACKILFQEDLCIHAKTGVFTLEDETRAQKWCRAAEKTQGFAKWDRVFIPINENNSHWYSACINFRHKRIDIYDSLREVCLNNREKPLQARKNTNTMLVLMWLAEILGRMKGEDVQLKNNPATMWKCDPHTKVPFQPNSYDCGVHTLWHLQHVLEFGWVRRDCESVRLRFSDDMVGKRLRLAQEILDDCHGRASIAGNTRD